MGIELPESHRRMGEIAKRTSTSLAARLQRKCPVCPYQLVQPEPAAASETASSGDAEKAKNEAAFWRRKAERLAAEAAEAGRSSNAGGSTSDELRRLNQPSRADLVRRMLNRDGHLVL
jgi:hypothetical protein